MRIRCYLPSLGSEGKSVVLSGREAHHLIRVLRVKIGTLVTCFDGQGLEAEGMVTQVHRRELTLSLKARRSLPPLKWELTLGVAVPSEGKLDRIVNEATQLGVRSIVPLTTARSVARPAAAARFHKKQIRWSQIAIEASKQSGAVLLPSVEPLTSWESFVPRISHYDLTLLATVQGPHESLLSLISHAHRRILLFIGPEGDFTPEEVSLAMKAGAHRICLGPRVLRCETAVVAALSVVNFLLNERQRPHGPR